MKNKFMRHVSVILVLALLLSCTFAWFTDSAVFEANGTAGTVAVSLDSDINLLNPEGKDIINPGDMRDSGFTVTNEGNKSIDVRTTIALTVQSETHPDLVFTGDGTTQSEYDLYNRNDVEFIEGEGWKPKDGAQPLQVKSIDQDVITYVIPQYSLNGNSDKYDEVETIDGVTEFKHLHDYVFIMKGDAGNAWQKSVVQIDVLVEAKQHENTSGGWDIVAQEQITTGNITQSTVKGENVITQNGTAGPAGDENESVGTVTPDGDGTITFSLKNSDTDAGVPGARMTLVKSGGSSIQTYGIIPGVYAAEGDEIVGTVLSDANGEGRFENLPDGEYYFTSTNFQLTAEANDLAITEDQKEDHYQYYGSLSDWTCTLTGQVVLESGLPVGNQKVGIYDSKTGEFIINVTTNENGEFSVYPMTAGSYEAKINGYKPVYGDKLTISILEGQAPDVLLIVEPNNTVDNSRVGVLEPGIEFNAHIPADTTEIVFTKMAVPAGVETVDVSEVKDESILAWHEGTTMYVANVTGGKIIANEDCSRMFENKTGLTKIVFNGLDTSNTINMNKMFYKCSNLTSLNISSFDTSKVEDMSYMFNSCSKLFTVYVSDLWSVESITTLQYGQYMGNASQIVGQTGSSLGSAYSYANYQTGGFIFSENGHNTLIAGRSFNSLIPVGVTEVYIGSYRHLIPEDKSQLIDLSVEGDMSVVGFLDGTKFYVTTVDGTEIKTTGTMEQMFNNKSVITVIEFANIDTSAAVNMEKIFYNCSGLTELDISCLNTANVYNMSNMFALCKLSEIDVTNFDTGSCKDMSYMFYNCKALKELDLSSFNTPNLTDVSYMFYFCDKLTTIYVSDLWTVENVTTATGVIQACYALSGQNNPSPFLTGKDPAILNYETGALTHISQKPVE